MLQNYLKIAFRTARNHWFFAAVNVLGLTLGMACCFLIVLYVWHESSYDQFYPQGDRLYQVQYRIQLAQELEIALVPPPVGPLLTDYFPEIEAAARLYPRNVSVSVPESQVQLEMEDVYFADSSVTRVFDFTFIQGRAEDALQNPFSVVLTRQTAETLFGSTDVVGRRLRLADRDEFTVTGVVEDWPEPSHLTFSMLVPFDNMFDLEPADMRAAIRENLSKNWVASHSYTYVLLKEQQSAASVNAKFPAFLQQYGFEDFRDKQSFSLFPVRDIHLYATAQGQPRPTANLDYLYLFVGIGIITLLIACINFVNLSTVSSIERAKEVGVRKVLGAKRAYLVGQFLGESLLYSFIAFLFSLVVVTEFLPALSDLLDVQLRFEPLRQMNIVWLFIAIFVLSGLLAGSYPALLVSRFQPVAVLKGSKGNTRQAGGLTLRKSLITLQFLAAIVFIGGAISVFQQLRYLRNQPLGFDKELVLSIPLNSVNMNAVFRGGDPQMRQRMNALDETLLRYSHIQAVTQCYQLPGLGAVRRKVWTDQISPDENLFVDILAVDYDYAETFGLQTVAGRDFDLAYGTDHEEGFVINEQGVKTFGWQSPEVAIGQRLTLEGKEGKVVGVVRDFNFQSLRAAIAPLVMEVRPGAFSYYAVRISNADIPATLAFIEQQWKAFFPEKVFEYTFLEEELNTMYQGEQQLAGIIAYFAFAAIFISCFGLLGITALTTQQRFKEIGIRKVLGASVGQILQLLTQDFFKLLGIALLIATPLTWYGVKEWLADFEFRIDFPWWSYLAAGLGVVLLAFVTLCGQAIKVAYLNPVDALRDE